MPTYELRGISIHFPHEAYQCQLDFMEKGENALLESPTGTGKTLCLLSAALAWRSVYAANHQLSEALTSCPGYDAYTGQDTPIMAKDTCDNQSLLSAAQNLCGTQQQASTASFGKRRVPLIIYASRTHSQLSQVIAELRNTVYRPKVAVIGSREQLCINASVKTGSTSNACLQALCTQLTKKKACSYYAKVPETLPVLNASFNQSNGKIFDIEDIVKFGRNHQACPYYLSREGYAEADVLFMPYNYILDRKSRGISLDLENSIVIFDEAHNLEGFCGDVSSFDIETDDLHAALKEIKTLEVMIANEDYFGSLKETDISLVKSKAAIGEIILDSIMDVSLKDGHFTSRGDFVYDMMARCGIHGQNVRALLDRTNTLAKAYLEDLYSKSKPVSKCSLQNLETVIRTLFKDSPESTDGKGPMIPTIGKHDSPAFRIFLTEDTGRKKTGTQVGGRKMSLWCFNPGMALRDLAQARVRSCILASGTLSPMSSFAHELQMTFAQQLENAHVIQQNQLFVSVLKTGPNDLLLDSSFQNRGMALYKSELGLAIGRVARIIPDGLLVFFPSYTLMESCLDHWKGNQVPGERGTIWGFIGQAKTPFIEPKSKVDLAKVMSNYAQVIEEKGKGAVFFAVCRGKVSEGLDFSDAKGRAVIITGIPFPPFKDPKVMLKKDYLQDVMLKKSTGSTLPSLSGEEWYSQQASRAVNQAIGRVIRHRNDYGAILFFDERYSQQKNINQLSKWVRPRLRVSEGFTGLCSALSGFFLQHDNHERADLQIPLAPIKDSLSETLELRQTLQRAKDFFCTKPRINQPVPIQLGLDSLESLVEPQLPKSMFQAFAAKRPHSPALVSEQKRLCLDSVPLEIEETKQEATIVNIDVAKEYLAKVRSSLSDEAFKKFTNLLRSYRAKQVDIASLVGSLLRLFASHNCLDHIDDFKTFVTPKNRKIFEEKVAEYRAASQTKSTVPQAKSTPLAARPHVKIEPVVQKILNSKALQTGKDPCPICREAVEKPFQAKCGHICCFSCWSTWLNNTLECPLCRQRTRMSQLKKIYQ